jgi:hypothetical protein
MAELAAVLHIHPTQFRYTGQADPSAPGGMAEIYRALIDDETRLDQIIVDVRAAHTNGANILVLTTWIDHLNAIAERLRNAGMPVVVLSDQIKACQRREISQQLANHTADAGPLLIVGTSSFLGEGFDCPALDTLFLAAPITFKNRLVQYVGRITRPHAGKSTATVHDYHDELTPVLASSLRKRAPGYTNLGFPDPRTLVRKASPASTASSSRNSAGGKVFLMLGEATSVSTTLRAHPGRSKSIASSVLRDTVGRAHARAAYSADTRCPSRSRFRGPSGPM